MQWIYDMIEISPLKTKCKTCSIVFTFLNVGQISLNIKPFQKRNSLDSRCYRNIIICIYINSDNSYY